MAIPVIYDVQVVAQQQGRILVAWRPLIGSIIPAGTQLEIHRSYGPEDGYVLVDTVAFDDGLYIDSDHDVQDQWTVPYYKLVVLSPDGDLTFGPYFMRNRPDKIGRKITRAMNMLMRNVGVPVLIYQEGFGPGTSRCPDCWDPISMRAIYTNCDTCHGSTYIGGGAEGFYNPILTLADIRPPVKVQVIEDQVKQPSTTSMRMSNYPILRPRDIVREVNSGVLWRVVLPTPQEKDRVILTQDPVELIQIKPGDIEKDLPVPTSLIPVLRRRVVRTERLVVDNDSGSPQILELRV